MTLTSDFESALSGLFNPETGLGEAIDFDGTVVNALVRYDTEVDESGGKFDVMDVDLLRSYCVDVPSYRTVAVVSGKTWHFWKQVFADAISIRLRFRANQRSQFEKDSRRA